MKNFLDISEISATAIRKIIDDAKIRKAKRKELNKSSFDEDKPMEGKSMIMIFENLLLEQEFRLILQLSSWEGQLLLLIQMGYTMARVTKA